MSDELKQSISEHGSRIGKLEQGQLETISAISSLRAQVTVGQSASKDNYADLKETIGDLADRMGGEIKSQKPKPPNLIGLFSVVMVVVGFVVGSMTNYITTRLKPTEETLQTMVTQYIETLKDAAIKAHDMGKAEQELEELSVESKRQWLLHHQHMKDISRMDAEIQDLRKHSDADLATKLSNPDLIPPMIPSPPRGSRGG